MLAIATPIKIVPCPFADSCQIATASCEAKDAEYCKPILINKKPQLTVIRTFPQVESPIECPNCGNNNRNLIETNNGNGPLFTCEICHTKKAMVCFVKPNAPIIPHISDF